MNITLGNLTISHNITAVLDFQDTTTPSRNTRFVGDEITVRTHHRSKGFSTLTLVELVRCGIGVPVFERIRVVLLRMNKLLEKSDNLALRARTPHHVLVVIQILHDNKITGFTSRWRS